MKTGVLAMKQAAPEAVVIVGAYKPVAEFIKLSKKIGFNPVFVNISFVGANALSKELGPEGKGVIVSQVVPFPADASLKVVADYQTAIKAADPKAEPEFVSLEGYLAGPPRHRGAGEGGQGRDARWAPQSHQGDGQVRHRRALDDVLGGEERRPRQGVDDHHRGGRFVQADREDDQDIEQLTVTPHLFANAPGFATRSPAR